MNWEKFEKNEWKGCKKCPRLMNTFVKPQIVEGAKLAGLAEAPGANEYEAARSRKRKQILVGSSGKLNDGILERAGVDRDKITLVNCVQCYVKGNPTPTVEEIECCSEVVEEALKGVEVVVAIGATATRRMLGEEKNQVKMKNGNWRTNTSVRKIRKWRGSILKTKRVIVLGKKSQLGPERYKSGKKEGELRKKRVDVEIVQKKRTVVLTLHPAELLRNGLAGLPMVTSDWIRARRIAEKRKMIEVGGEIKVKVEEPRILNAMLDGVRDVVIDVETEGLEGKLTMIGVAVSKDTACVVKPKENMIQVLRNFFLNKKNRFIAHNMCYDLRQLRKRGVEVKGRFWDTLHAGAYERPDIRERNQKKEGVNWDNFHSLDMLASRIGDLWYYNWKEEHRENRSGNTWKYCGMDSCTEFFLFETLKRRLEKTGRLESFEDVIVPLILITEEMREIGVEVDLKQLGFLQRNQDKILRGLEEKWKHFAPGVNYKSPKQLMEWFYDDKGMKAKYVRGRRSLGEDAIERLKEEYPKDKSLNTLLQIRHASKIRSTYLSRKDLNSGKVHWEYNPSGTVFGRLSSDAQQIPRSSDGCKLKIENCSCFRLRSLFVGDDGDEGIVVGDYSQIEARLTAILAGEDWLVKRFEEEDFDFHQETGDFMQKVIGGKWWKYDKKEVRELGKRGNHMMNYVGGVKAVMSWFECEEWEANEILNAIHKQRPKTIKWWGKLMKIVEEKGYLINPFGRRAYFTPKRKGNMWEYELPKIVSSQPQSTAMDVISRAMVRLWKEGVNLKIQAHDELVSSVKSWKEKKMIREIMEMEFPELGNWSCPVDIGKGKNWEEAKRNS